MERSLLWSALGVGCVGALATAAVVLAARVSGKERSAPASLAPAYIVAAVVVAALVFLASLPSRPPFAAGHGFGTGFLIGAAGALLSGLLLARATRAEDDQALFAPAIVTTPMFLAVIAASVPALWMRAVVTDGLAGVAIGWFATALLLALGLPGGEAEGDDRAGPASLSLLASAGFAAAVCGAAMLGVFRGEQHDDAGRWIAAALALACAVPLSVVICSVPAGYLARVGVKLPFRRWLAALTERATQGRDEEGRRMAARAWRALFCAVLVLALGKVVSVRVLTLTHLFHLVGVGLTVGLMTWWLVVDAARSDADADASGGALGARLGRLAALPALVLLAGVIVAWNWLAGYGIAVVVLGAWLAGALAQVSAIEQRGEPRLAAPAVTVADPVRALLTVLLAGTILVLYRVAAQRFDDAFRGASLADYYAVLGFLLGAIVPSLLAELQGANAPLSPARRLARLAIAGLLTLAVPALAIALWKTKTILAMLAGLAFSGVLRGQGESANRGEAAARAALLTTVFALGIALSIAQWTGHAAAFSALSRHEKMLVVRWAVVALVVTIAAVDVIERLRGHRAAPSNREAAEGGTAR